VLPADRFPVVTLKIHSWPSHRKAVSGLFVSTTSSTVVVVVPDTMAVKRKLDTTPGVPMETPFASYTANFAGTVRPWWKTLEPSALIGGWKKAKLPYF